jgi:uncharacterized repeat protein (TIGR03803 family)
MTVRNSNRITLRAGLALALSGLCASALAATFSIIVNMPDCLNGCNANEPGLVAQGFDGNLYTTMPAQVFGQGTVVAFPPSVPASFNSGTLPTLPVIHPLKGNDGSAPQSGLTLGTDGAFYGAAIFGGPPPSSGASGLGSIFKVTFPNPAVAGSTNQAATYTTLYTFKNNGDGAHPNAPPVQGPDGNLYGVTYDGGNIYRIGTNGVGFVVLAHLNLPMQTPLTVGEDGNLYGVTADGGNNGYGTIFQMTLAGQVTPLYSFHGANDGGHPHGKLLWARDGMLYGSSTMGGAPSSQGVIFRQDPHVVNAYTIVHALAGMNAAEGSGITAGLMQGSDGRLYGLASAGGTGSVGTLFTLDTSGTTFTVLKAFSGGDGTNPYSTPALHTNGVIYSATKTGGPLSNGAEGLVFSYSPGMSPFASLVGSTRSFPATAAFGVLGQGFTQATGVKVGTGVANFSVVSDTYMVVYAPGVCVGRVLVSEPNNVTLATPQVVSVSNATITKFQVCPVRLPPLNPRAPLLH